MTLTRVAIEDRVAAQLGEARRLVAALADAATLPVSADTHSLTLRSERLLLERALRSLRRARRDYRTLIRIGGGA